MILRTTHIDPLLSIHDHVCGLTDIYIYKVNDSKTGLFYLGEVQSPVLGLYVRVWYHSSAFVDSGRVSESLCSESFCVREFLFTLVNKNRRY